MATPTIADKQPKPVELEAGKTYTWCACGASSNQPFCDGSHSSTEFTPVVFTAEKSETKYMCMCKHSSSPTFCDGSHKAL
ncbi:MAG: CDGSH iron-sulfur domain-containing protein [Cyclobacteriaceae bacterium]